MKSLASELHHLPEVVLRKDFLATRDAKLIIDRKICAALLPSRVLLMWFDIFRVDIEIQSRGQIPNE